MAEHGQGARKVRRCWDRDVGNYDNDRMILCKIHRFSIDFPGWLLQLNSGLSGVTCMVSTVFYIQDMFEKECPLVEGTLRPKSPLQIPCFLSWSEEDDSKQLLGITYIRWRDTLWWLNMAMESPPWIFLLINVDDVDVHWFSHEKVSRFFFKGFFMIQTDP